jgi:hypothetical protein
MQLQDGFGFGQSSAGTGDIQAIFDQVPTSPFNHAGGNRRPLAKYRSY